MAAPTGRTRPAGVAGALTPETIELVVEMTPAEPVGGDDGQLPGNGESCRG